MRVENVSIVPKPTEGKQQGMLGKSRVRGMSQDRAEPRGQEALGGLEWGQGQDQDPQPGPHGPGSTDEPPRLLQSPGRALFAIIE